MSRGQSALASNNASPKEVKKKKIKVIRKTVPTKVQPDPVVQKDKIEVPGSANKEKRSGSGGSKERRAGSGGPKSN